MVSRYAFAAALLILLTVAFAGGTHHEVRAQVGGSGAGVGVPPGNPTATAGPSANNGSAATYMRSDASPAVQLGTNAQQGIVQGDGSSLSCTSGVCTVVSSPLVLPLGYISGLQIGSMTTTSVTMNPGVARDSANAHNITIGSSWTKTTSGSFTAGSGNAGMGTGLTFASGTTYHLFAIYNTTTTASDFYFDTSVTAANIPSGWTSYRRVASLATLSASAAFVTLTQFNNEFLYGTPINTLAGAVPTTPTLVSVAVPTGVKVLARLRTLWTSSGGINYLLQSPDETSAAPNAVTGNIDATGASGVAPDATLIVRTNTSAQVRWSASASGGTGYVTAYGYFDYP